MWGCPLCGNSTHQLNKVRVCKNCFDTFVPATPWKQNLSLFRYQGLFRDLILSVKLKSNPRAVAALLTLLEEHPSVEGRYKSKIDLVLPAPSSLWSRIRGRLDLAFLCAQHLSALWGIPMAQAPWQLHWKLTKRALVAERISIPLQENKPLQLPDPQHRTLLIDDIFTSGYTLTRLRASLPAHWQCSYLTLADASARNVS